MIWLVLGAGALFLLLGASREFSRARVATLRALGAWVVALGGLSLGTLLLLTGRGAAAIAALALLGPLAWTWFREGGAQPAGTAARPRPRPQPGPASGRMTPEEACAVLGVRSGASEADIRAAHRRLMRAAHPDGGGSDWIAARVNQARDVLLGR